MAAHALRHLAADGQHRVQAVHDVLKDHGDFFAPDQVQLRRGQGKQVLSLKQNFAPGDFSLPGQQPQNGQGGHAFAAAALPH